MYGRPRSPGNWPNTAHAFLRLLLLLILLVVLGGLPACRITSMATRQRTPPPAAIATPTARPIGTLTPGNGEAPGDWRSTWSVMAMTISTSSPWMGPGCGD